MNTLLLYLLQVSIAITVFYLIYWLFLRDETYFTLNRIYLLGSTIFSLALPFFNLNISNIEMAKRAVVYLDPILITPHGASNSSGFPMTWADMIWIIYLAGAFILAIHFIQKLIQLFYFVKKYRVSENTNGLKIVVTNHKFTSFSFFNMVFIPGFEDKTIDTTAILYHEYVHARQFHTIDLLFLELLKIMVWFNPFIWLLGRSVKTVHEFLADEGVIRMGYSSHEYQYLLVNLASGIQVTALSNNFNFSLLKNRIVMMTKSRSAAFARGKVLLALPAIFALLFFFSLGNIGNILAQDKKTTEIKPTSTTSVAPKQETKPVKEKSTQVKFTEPVFTMVEKMPEYTGGDEARIKFLVENVKYPPDAMKKGIQGKVFVTFVIKKDGTVSDVKILRGIGGGCDEEAMRVIKLMPKWIPGEQAGKPVDVQFNLPIKFALDCKEPKKEEPKK
ncbi:MAG: M56 family metallopeptidase [Bacteroidota bacterium]